MKKIYISASILTVAAVIIFLCMAPHLIRTSIVSENKVSYEQPVPSVAHGLILSQQFVPQYEQIESIDVYINALSCSREEGSLCVKITGGSAEVLYDNKLPLAMLPEYGMTSIVKDVTLAAGDTYNLTIEAVDTLDDGPAISFFPNEIAANEEECRGGLTYAGQLLENAVLRAAFRYSVPLSPINYLPYCLFIAFVIFLCMESLALSARK
ncbi:MAG: hypothetical protein K2L86_05735 [Lachnospiraceae bacterium]|nr:hypothetical protein [Lachnospiraceae bacterium]